MLRMNALLAGLTAAVTEPLSGEQHKELTTRANSLQMMILDDYRGQAVKIRTIDSDNAAALKVTHDGYIADVLPKVERMKVVLDSKKPGGQVVQPAQPVQRSGQPREHEGGGGEVRGDGDPILLKDGSVRVYGVGITKESVE